MPKTTAQQAITRDVVEAAVAGDEAAFSVIYDAYANPIYSFIFCNVYDQEIARDLTQDVFVRAWLNISQLQLPLNVGAWLYRIASRLLIDRARHERLVQFRSYERNEMAKSQAQNIHDPDRTAFQVAVGGELEAQVMAVLDKLPTKQRIALILREWYQLSYDEIAAALNTTRHAVKSLLFRAREEFRAVCAMMARNGEPIPTLA